MAKTTYFGTNTSSSFSNGSNIDKKCIRAASGMVGITIDDQIIAAQTTETDYFYCELPATEPGTDGPGSATYDIEATIASGDSNGLIAFAVARVASDGTIEETSGFSTQVAATVGLKTASITHDLSPWTSGDMLAVVVQIENTAMHGDIGIKLGGDAIAHPILVRAPWSRTARAIEIETAFFDIPLSGSTADFLGPETFAAGITPKAYIVWAWGQSTADDNRHALSVGFCDGTTEQSDFFRMLDAQTSMDASRISWSDSVFGTVDQGGVDMRMDHNAFIEGGVRLNLTFEGSGGFEDFVAITFIGGTGVTGADVSSITANAAQDASQNLTGLSVNPNLVFYSCVGQTSRNTWSASQAETAADASLSFGMAIDNGTSIEQAGFVFFAEDAATTSNQELDRFTNRCIGASDAANNDSVDWRLECTSMGTGSVNHTMRSAAGNSELINVLAIELDTNDLSIDTVTIPTSGDPTDEPTLNYETHAMIALGFYGTSFPVSSGNGAEQVFNLGTAQQYDDLGGTQRITGLSNSFISEDGVTTSQTNFEQQPATTPSAELFLGVLASDVPTDSWYASLTSISSTSYQIQVDLSPAVASEAIILAIGIAAAGGGDITKIVPLGTINVSGQVTTGAIDSPQLARTINVSGQIPTTATVSPQQVRAINVSGQVTTGAIDSAQQVRTINISGQVPVGAISSPQGVRAINLSTFAPSVVNPSAVNPPAASITVSGQIPTTATDSPMGFATLNVSGQVPIGAVASLQQVRAINVTGQIPTTATISPMGVRSITVSGQAPSWTIGIIRIIPLATINVSGQTTTGAIDSAQLARTINVSGQNPTTATVSPMGVRSITVSGQVTTGAIDSAQQVRNINLTGQVPIGAIVSPQGVRAINLSTFAPQVINPSAANPPAASITVSGQIPTTATDSPMGFATLNVSGQIPTFVIDLRKLIPVATINVSGQVTTGAIDSAQQVRAINVSGQIPVGAISSLQGIATINVSGQVTTGAIDAAIPVRSINVSGQIPVGAISAAIPVRAINITGQVPTWNISAGDITAIVPLASLNLSGLIPTTATTSPQQAASITVSGQVPIPNTSWLVPVASINVSGLAPSVINPSAVNPPTANITVSGQIPATTTVSPMGVASITISGQTPIGAVAANIPVASITVTGLIPTLILPGIGNVYTLSALTINPLISVRDVTSLALITVVDIDIDALIKGTVKINEDD